MPLIVINDDKQSKEQMRSNMREHMRHSYRGDSGSWVSSGNYKSYPSEHYRTEEAYKDGYYDGWKDHEEEEYRRRDSMGRYI